MNILYIAMFLLIIPMTSLWGKVETTDSTNQFIYLTIESGTTETVMFTDTLEVLLKSDFPIGGFDFKIGSFSEGFIITEILPGKLIDSCEWEYFYPRKISINDFPKLNSAFQIVALPEMIADSVHPVCYNFDREVSVFKIVISNSNSISHTSTRDKSLISFIWEDCGDNSISSVSGDTLSLFSNFENEDSTAVQSFPTPSEECLNKATGDRLRRLIKFKNGYFEFKLEFE